MYLGAGEEMNDGHMVMVKRNLNLYGYQDSE